MPKEFSEGGLIYWNSDEEIIESLAGLGMRLVELKPNEGQKLGIAFEGGSVDYQILPIVCEKKPKRDAKTQPKPAIFNSWTFTLHEEGKESSRVGIVHSIETSPKGKPIAIPSILIGERGINSQNEVDFISWRALRDSDMPTITTIFTALSDGIPRQI